MLNIFDVWNKNISSGKNKYLLKKCDKCPMLEFII